MKFGSEDSTESRITFGSFEVFIFLTGIYFLVELIVGIVFNSIILQADAFHMLSDFVALIIGYSSKKINHCTSDKHTYGYQRSEILGGLVNSTFLLALCFTLFVESIQRLIILEKTTNPWIVLYTGLGGLAVNIIGMLLFHNHDTHNAHAVYLHVLGDFLGSICVIVSMLVIIYSSFEYKYYLDPLITIFIVLILSFNNVKVFVSTCNILLHKIPLELDIQDLELKLKGIDGVSAIKEFHIWSLNDKINICSAHIYTLKNDSRILESCKKVLHENNIHNSSLQITNVDYVEFICENKCEQCCKENT